jgi:DNA-directed RNA polymerase subunit RPC12/RpoP
MKEDDSYWDRICPKCGKELVNPIIQTEIYINGFGRIMQNTVYTCVECKNKFLWIRGGLYKYYEPKGKI